MTDTTPKRTSVADARAALDAGSTLLVCVYPPDKYAKANLVGSIGYKDFKSRESDLSKDADVIFY